MKGKNGYFQQFNKFTIIYLLFEQTYKYYLILKFKYFTEISLYIQLHFGMHLGSGFGLVC